MTSKDRKINRLNSKIDKILGEWGYPLNSQEFLYRKQRIHLWLKNFKVSEMDLAMVIIERIQYYKQERINQYIESCAKQIKRIFGQELNKVLFFSLGLSSASSGSLFLYQFKKELELGDENFPECGFTSYLNKNINIVFFDDIIGSGNQATRFFNKYLKESKANCFYFSIFGFEKGIKKIETETGFKKVLSTEQFTNEDKAFDKESQIIPEPDLRNSIEQISKYYGNMLFPRYPNGYDDSQALIVFDHNIPNNTLPIVWASPKNESNKKIIWNPLFERKKKTKPSFASIPNKKQERTLNEVKIWIETDKENLSIGLITPIPNSFVNSKNIRTLGFIKNSDSNINNFIQAVIITDIEYPQNASPISKRGFWNIEDIILNGTHFSLFFKVFSKENKLIATSNTIKITKV